MLMWIVKTTTKNGFQRLQTSHIPHPCDATSHIPILSRMKKKKKNSYKDLPILWSTKFVVDLLLLLLSLLVV